MDNFLYIGKIVNTFGIKGEVKVKSDFEYKERIFKKDFKIYIGEAKIEEVIETYRVHKNFDLLTFKGYGNINEILKYKGLNIYLKRSDLPLDDNEYLLSDLIGMAVYDEDSLLGIVVDYEKNNNILLKVKGEKSFYLPLVDNFIIKVDKVNKKIITNNGKDLIL